MTLRAENPGDAQATRPVLCRSIAPADVAGARKLMRALEIVVAGTRAGSMYGAICRDAIRNRGAVVDVAAGGADLCGLVVAMIEWRRYWRRFALRRPLLAAAMCLRRFRGACGAGPAAPQVHAPDFAALAPYLSQESPGFRWEDSSPQIAKVLFVGVLPQYRGQGIAARLYRALFDELRQREVNCLHCRIACDNLASVRLHHRLGWQITLAEHILYATFAL
jgi:ribosomal protein S18 acetylase RimI-like enzyme